MSSACVTWNGKHAFEPRYDEVEIPGALETMLKAYCYSEVDRSKYLRKVYVQDVCPHCGEVVDRPNVPIGSTKA